MAKTVKTQAARTKKAFRRCGQTHPAMPDWQGWPPGTFTAAQIAILEAEPMVNVLVIDAPDAPEIDEAKPEDILAGNVRQVRAAIEGMSEAEVVALGKLEKKGKNRQSVIDAIEQRLETIAEG